MTIHNQQRIFLDIYSTVLNIVGYNLVTRVRIFKCVSIKAFLRTNNESVVRAKNKSYIGMNYII